ncbi:MAG: phosphate ABC transporter permease PstA [Syntrophorhabdaceae bacterium]|nr:phosphate ABC transporter permease PstA [Syntrophorhabdaceae bacterium]
MNREDLKIYTARYIDHAFAITGLLCCLASLGIIAVLFFDLVLDGLPRITSTFFFSFPSRIPEKAGILSAWVGSVIVIVVTALFSIPIGVATGIYLEEYGKKNWITDIIEINISNLAGVPSIIYGLLSLSLFVYLLKFGESILTGGLTLGLLILPIVITATRESIRTIPQSIREASYALGATKWQTIRWHIIPYSTGGILTGIIIGLSRAIGETAPLITIGALTFIAFLPSSPIQPSFPFISFGWLFDAFTVMPVQIFNWISRPQKGFHINAAAASSVLLVMTLLLNGIAIYIRYRFRRRIRW